MLKNFCVIFFVMAISFIPEYAVEAFSCENLQILTAEQQEYEVSQIISKSKNVAELMKKNGGEDEAMQLMNRLEIVERHFKEKNQQELLNALQKLRAEVLFRQSKFNLAMAYYVRQSNDKKGMEVLKFLNSVQNVLRDIEKRINRIRGEKDRKEK